MDSSLRGNRKRTRPPLPEQPPKPVKRKFRVSNDPRSSKNRGYLCGDFNRGFYDLDGHYCRRRGHQIIVENYGPKAAFRALSEEERSRVIRARRAKYRRDEKLGTLPRQNQGEDKRDKRPPNPIGRPRK